MLRGILAILRIIAAVRAVIVVVNNSKNRNGRNMNKDSNTKNSYSHRQNSNKRVGAVESVRVGRGLVSRGSASHRGQGFERRKTMGT